MDNIILKDIRKTIVIEKLSSIKDEQDLFVSYFKGHPEKRRMSTTVEGAKDCAMEIFNNK